MKNLYLVDVSSLFFRSFYAIRNLTNSKGFPTNAVYGFLSAITKILKEHSPDGVVFCLDRPEPGVREELYEDYKANRDEPPDDLQKQFPYIKRVAEALNIPTFDCIGYEADDIIGTLAIKAHAAGVPNVVIVSGDKDFGQLVQPGVRIFDPAKDVYIDSHDVKAKWGIEPKQVIDYLALVGDSSDNIPGVAGIGPKGAQKLLTQFESLDGIYKNLPQIANERLREKLSQSKDVAYLSQKLSTIHTSVDLAYSLDDLRLRPINREILITLMEELEFKTMLQRYLGAGASPSAETAPALAPEKAPVIPSAARNLKVTVATDIPSLEKLFSKDKSLWVFATDRGVAVANETSIARYEGSVVEFKSWIGERLTDQGVSLSGYDTKDILHWLGLHGKTVTIADDLLLAAYCLGDQDDLTFDVLVGRLTGRTLPEFASSDERLSVAMEVMQTVRSRLEPLKAEKIYRKLECSLVPVLFKMESHGIMINVAELETQSLGLTTDSQNLEKEICGLAGEEFNVGSPKQLSKILFEKLKLPVVRKTKTGLSTDSDVLEKLKDQHPICEKILEWRELTKLKSTYVDALPRLRNEKTGRVHTTYDQALTTTGRLSSYNPNLQNIPIRTKRGQRIREAFIAPEGKLLVSADYSQVELRILAHITDDPGLKKAFNEDIDIHQATASDVFDVKLDEVTPNQRRAAKAINFGIAYGMSDFGLSESLGIDRKEAGDYIARYFQRYPRVHQYMEDIVEIGKKQGYVETTFGRRRFYPAIRSSNRRIAQMAERAVINMPIQGAAADIMKIAMIQIDKNLSDWASDEAYLLLQVHDELVFEVSKSRVVDFSKAVKEWMETAVQLSVPLKASVGSGPTWGQAH